jgi:hypothetical protein
MDLFPRSALFAVRKRLTGSFPALAPRRWRGAILAADRSDNVLGLHLVRTLAMRANRCAVSVVLPDFHSLVSKVTLPGAR